VDCEKPKKEVNTKKKRRLNFLGIELVFIGTFNW